jgi:hypothetical protein
VPRARSLKLGELAPEIWVVVLQLPCGSGDVWKGHDLLEPVQTGPPFLLILDGFADSGGELRAQWTVLAPSLVWRDPELLADLPKKVKLDADLSCDLKVGPMQNFDLMAEPDRINLVVQPRIRYRGRKNAIRLRKVSDGSSMEAGLVRDLFDFLGFLDELLFEEIRSELVGSGTTE